MIKKLTALSATLFLAGCQGMLGPAYKLSDEDAQKWINLGNEIGQCLFPKEWKSQNFNSLSNEERMLHLRWIENSLVFIIGNQNFQKLRNDPMSRQYANRQWTKFYHNRPTNLDAKTCQTLKKEFNKALKQVRMQIKEEQRKRQELEAYYRTPAGQMELMRQQMAQQHREMMAQQDAIRQQQADAATWNMINSIGKNVSPTFNYNQNYQMQNINRSLNQINSTLQNMTPTQGTGPRWHNVY
ncbi:DUF5358 family protein [Avibacterium gallinarum]|uniref:DUF5358 family protein n=1 Tax=Avibacterium gallinarum TaxID=755 RepID=UPI0039FC8382